ncbi:MAG TPA: sporulation integral membrane protein YlbJ, partial [Bacillales bacterium]|nr:sporulation integral membrane protein YlbJ [Bacillales bacterium]
IGGFIILFSVINKIFTILHLTNALSSMLSVILTQLNLPSGISNALVAGFFEITLGSQTASQAQAPLVFKAAAASFVLAFSGLSVQAQVASILADTDIDFKPFFFARCMHGIFSAILTILLWKPLFIHRVAANGNHAINVAAMGNTQSWELSVWKFLLHYGADITFVSLLAFILIALKASKRKFPV